MNAVTTLIGTLIGAGIAFSAQWIFERRRRKEKLGELLLEQSALLIALNDDFENRMWEERELNLKHRVDAWDLASSRLAKAKIEILSSNQDLDAALAKLHSSGVAIGGYWRHGNRDDVEFSRYLAEYQAARLLFSEASSAAIRKILAG